MMMPLKRTSSTWFTTVVCLLAGTMVTPGTVGQTTESDNDADLPASFLPFGLGAADSTVPEADDGSSPTITLNTDFVFHQKREAILYVNTNGILSFGSPFDAPGPSIITCLYGLHPLLMIAPFFHDFDVTIGGTIYYRQTSDPTDLATVATTLQNVSNLNTFSPTLLFIATWDRVAPFSAVGPATKRNTFQVILATDNQTSAVIFNYGEIEWGEGAVIGFNTGDGADFFTLPLSGTPNTTNIETQSNVGVPGQFVYMTSAAGRSCSDDLVNPVGGLVTYSTLLTATYTCEDGRVLQGNQQRTCQSDGTWDGTDPTCAASTITTIATTSANDIDTSASSTTYATSTGHTSKPSTASSTLSLDGAVGISVVITTALFTFFLGLVVGVAVTCFGTKCNIWGKSAQNNVEQSDKDEDQEHVYDVVSPSSVEMEKFKIRENMAYGPVSLN